MLPQGCRLVPVLTQSAYCRTGQWLQQTGLAGDDRSQNSTVLTVLRPHKAYLCDMMAQRQKQHYQTHLAEHSLRLLTMRAQACKGLGPTSILRCVTAEVRVLIVMGYKLTMDLCTECASLIWKTCWSLMSAPGQWGLSCLTTNLLPTETKISLGSKQLCI